METPQMQTPEQQRKVLLFHHSSEFKNFFGQYADQRCVEKGYNLNENIVEGLDIGQYHAIGIEANLGHPGTMDIGNCVKLYGLLLEIIKNNEHEIFCFSGTVGIDEEIKKQINPNLKNVSKTDLVTLLNNYRQN